MSTEVQADRSLAAAALPSSPATTSAPASAPAPVARPSIHASSPYLTDRGREIRDAVRDLIPLIRRDAQQAEQQGHLTDEVLSGITAAGVFSMTMPLEFGGSALGIRDVAEVMAALGEGDGSAGWSAFVGVGIRNVLLFPQSVVDEVAAEATTWIGPLVVGASVFSTAVGPARKVDGGWMVKGTWGFGSGSKHARWAYVGVEYDRVHGSGRGVVMLDRDQYTILDDWKVMGLSASASNTLQAKEEVFVADERFLDLADFPTKMDLVRTRYSGLAFRAGTLGLMLAVATSNIAIAVGMARGALSVFAEQAPKRKPFNLPYDTLAEMPAVQLQYGRAAAQLAAAEWIVFGIADEVDRRALEGEDFAPVEEADLTLNLSYAARLCLEAIDLLQNTMGSSTASLKNPIQRFYRDTKILSSHGALRLDPVCELAGKRGLGVLSVQMMASGLPDRAA